MLDKLSKELLIFLALVFNTGWPYPTIGKIILNFLEIESRLGLPILLDLTTSKVDSWRELLELTSEGIFKFEAEKKISLS